MSFNVYRHTSWLREGSEQSGYIIVDPVKVTWRYIDPAAHTHYWRRWTISWEPSPQYLRIPEWEEV